MGGSVGVLSNIMCLKAKINVVEPGEIQNEPYIPTPLKLTGIEATNSALKSICAGRGRLLKQKLTDRKFGKR